MTTPLTPAQKPNKLTETAPKEIYLQVGDDEQCFDDDFNHVAHDEITWCKDSVLLAEVKYIRADLVEGVTPAQKIAYLEEIREVSQNAINSGKLAMTNAMDDLLLYCEVVEQCHHAMIDTLIAEQKELL